MVFGVKLGLSRKAPAASQPESVPPAEKKNRTPSPTGNSGGIGGGGGKKQNTLTVNEFVARTKKCREKGLEPTKPELIAYARYLGVDPINDGDLMWIANEALNAPLPAEWTEHHDSADRVFYYNVQTRASSWTHPLEQLHRDTYKAIVNFRSGQLSKEEQMRELDVWRQRCEEAERDAHRELQAWTEHVDDQGTKFFYNSNLQRSVWTDPRPARCHTLYLQMKALRALSRACGHPYATREAEPAEQEPPVRAQQHPERPARHEDERPAKPRTDVMGSTSGFRASMRKEGSSPKNKGIDMMNSTLSATLRKEESWTTKSKAEIMSLTGGFEMGTTLRKAASMDVIRQGSDTETASGPDMACMKNDKDQRRRKKKGRKDKQFTALVTSDLEEENERVSTLKQAATEDIAASLPMIGGRNSPVSLSTPPGDGLTSIRRAKVRAGIKLEPLRVGA